MKWCFTTTSTSGLEVLALFRGTEEPGFFWLNLVWLEKEADFLFLFSFLLAAEVASLGIQAEFAALLVAGDAAALCSAPVASPAVPVDWVPPVAWFVASPVDWFLDGGVVVLPAESVPIASPAPLLSAVGVVLLPTVLLT